MPRYDRYEKLRREIASSVRRGALVPIWAEDSKSLRYEREGKRYRFDIETRTETEDTQTTPARGGGRRRTPERGRQFDTVLSPDGRLKAYTKERNVWVSLADGKKAEAITQEGSAEKRVKYGEASWVYGEELEVREAIWWSPDGTRLAFYRFDESPVKDYYLGLDQTKFQARLDTEAYPKAGTTNPVVGLLVHDRASGKTVEIDTRFGDPLLGEYVYDVRWSPSGKELLYHRTNRKQNAMELCAADPATGRSRTIVREVQPQSWAENHPFVEFLADGRRFVWSSERNGFRNLYLYDTNGRLIRPLTQHGFDVERIVRVDEERGTLFYTARSAENPYLLQLHRVGLDGKNDRRLTDPSLSHTVSLAPDGRHFVDVAQTATTAPVSRLLDAEGRLVAEIAKSDLSRFEAMGLRRVERFTFPAADGKTMLHGTLSFPSDFDPQKRYPLVVSVYAGPESGGAPETFQTPNPITEMGFLVASFEGRGTRGRGKAFRDAVYGKLGIVEIDDQAAGVRALAQRPYVDGKRVGIYGTSYGGYASIMALLRHPDTFQAASASSSVTDWRHYDTIYTERFQGLPHEGENMAGYDAGSALTHVQAMKGNLLLFFGTADNNVHPANTLQFVQALDRANKRYEMQIGPDQGHTGVSPTRMWEFFMRHLVLKPAQ